MKLLASLLAIALVVPGVNAAPSVVRKAPDFSFHGIGGVKSLRGLRAQPVVLLIAPTPKTKALKKQVRIIESLYAEYSSRGVVFVVAFTDGGDAVASDIPFVTASNGPAVGNAYGANGDFAIAIIGRDGNLDYVTNQVLPAFRIREVIQNSFDVQYSARKEIPKGPPQ